MAVTAESVVVELVAKTDGYSANINGAAKSTASAMSRIEQSASKAENQIIRSAGAMANAQRNLGRQFSDVGAQLAGGQSPFLILAQQAPQVADALADTGGKAAAVASFFAGPWGAALLAAGSVLAVFASKAFEAGESVDDLVAKLQQNAAKTAAADEAQYRFSRTTEGLAAALRETQKALDAESASTQRSTFLTLAKAEADRQAAIQARQRAAAELSVALARVEGNKNISAEGAELGASTIAKNEREAIRLRAELAKATQGVAAAERAVVTARAPIARQLVAEGLDAATKATGRYERALDLLYSKLKRGSLTEAQYTAAVTRETVKRDKALDAAREANKKPPTGPSAETLARRAETARVRDVRNNEAFSNDLEQLNAQILSLKRQATVDATDIANLSREEVEIERRRKLNAIDADEAAKKYSAAEADALRLKAEEVASLKNLAVSTEEIRRAAEEQLLSASNAVDRQSALLDAQGRIADTNEQRRAIELQLLDLKYEELRIAREAVTKDTTGRFTDAQRKEAQRDLDAIPQQRSVERAGVDRRYEGQFERYRREALGTDGLADSIDSIKIQTLESVTDELTNATKAALGLKGAFGDIVGELIRIGIQRRLIGPLANALFGPADGSGGSGAAGSALKAIVGFLGGGGGSFGRASGGYVGAGQTVRVNEGSGRGPELLRMGSQGGTVIPLGQMSAVSPSGGGDRHFHISVDARNSVTPAGFASQISREVLSQAAQMDVEAGKQTLRAAPGYIRQSSRQGAPKSI